MKKGGDPLTPSHRNISPDSTSRSGFKLGVRALSYLGSGLYGNEKVSKAIDWALIPRDMRILFFKYHIHIHARPGGRLISFSLSR